jgi:hypothetical protein
MVTDDFIDHDMGFAVWQPLCGGLPQRNIENSGDFFSQLGMRRAGKDLNRVACHTIPPKTGQMTECYYNYNEE